MSQRAAPKSSGVLLISVLLALLATVLLAVLVVVYVAFPHRDQQVPTMPWVGRLMRRGVDRLPTLDNQAQHQRDKQLH